jgi:hypothetical protein
LAPAPGGVGDDGPGLGAQEGQADGAAAHLAGVDQPAGVLLPPSNLIDDFHIVNLN